MALWALVVVATTLVLTSLRQVLTQAHLTLAYLLIVLCASAWSGRTIGLSVASLAFLAFNFFLLPPYYTLRLDDPLDWTLLVGFLITGAIAAQLFHRAEELGLARTNLAREAERVAALRDADRLKDAFVAGVSHDLRTPLTTIRALAVEMRTSDPDRAVVVEEEAQRLNAMVTDLLDLSRVRSGAVPLDLQVIAAEDLVGAALQRISGVPGAEGIEVRLPKDGSLPVGRMDFVQALRALANLLENALRHTDGPVELEVTVEGAWLAFAVLDRGPGLVEPTSDAPASGSPVERTGLGLAIARSLAEAQGGSVRYQPRPGGGSAFTLRLPAEAIPELE